MSKIADIHDAIWRASDQDNTPMSTVHTGHPALSAWLPGAGWPLGQLIEILFDEPGCGELSLLAPALASLSGNQPIVLLHPPLIPNIAAWQHWQIDTHRLWWIRPTQLRDAWWSAEQILRSQSVSALLCWADPIDDRFLRRLHWCAQSSEALFVMFRPRHSAHLFSPAILRLEVISDPVKGLALRLLKSRGPKPAHVIAIHNNATVEMSGTQKSHDLVHHALDCNTA